MKAEATLAKKREKNRQWNADNQGTVRQARREYEQTHTDIRQTYSENKRDWTTRNVQVLCTACGKTYNLRHKARDHQNCGAR